MSIDIGNQRLSHFAGTVFDPSGAAISGAVVTIKNREGKEWSEKTGPNGVFSFGNLPKGDYQFRITSLGFDPLVGSLSLQWRYFWHRSITFKMTVAT